MLHKVLLLMLAALCLLAGCAGAPSTSTVVPLEPQTQTGPKIVESIASASEPAGKPPVAPDPRKKVYLTFDDGPNSHYTGLILDVLKKYGVRASFAVVGSNIEKNPAVFQRILDEGHHVVNHSYTHDYKKIYTSPEAFLADLERTNQAIAPFTGQECKIFRAPGGPDKLHKNFRELLNRKGYISLGWNVASADTDPAGVSPEQIVENVKNGVTRIESMKKTPIILMHDGTEINVNMANPPIAVKNYIRNRESDVVALPFIIDFLQEKGYTFAGVDENTPPAW